MGLGGRGGSGVPRPLPPLHMRLQVRPDHETLFSLGMPAFAYLRRLRTRAAAATSGRSTSARAISSPAPASSAMTMVSRVTA